MVAVLRVGHAEIMRWMAKRLMLSTSMSPNAGIKRSLRSRS